MAQLNITLDQEEILHLLSSDSSGAFKELPVACLNSILKEESRMQLKAGPYERTQERTDCRNGTRDRELNTRIGTITLKVPRHRNGSFKTMVFENYSRSEAALISAMAEMVVNGVSTRKVSRVMETLCGTSYSRSAVSELCKDLDGDVERFRSRPLEEYYPFLTVDATYFKVREDHRIVSRAFMTALGTDEDGRSSILGFGVYPNESLQTWTDFLKSLKNRGLRDPMMITSDAHEGLVNAMGKVFPEVPWQRCQFHFSRNIADRAPKKYQSGLRAELQEMFNSKSVEEARKKRDSIIEDYKDVAESAMACLDEGFESSMTARMLPYGMYRHYRTSNRIERINRELKRRSKVIGVFPNEASLIRLMGSVLIEISDSAQGANRAFSRQYFRSVMDSEVPSKLKAIAEEQRKLLAAQAA